MRTAPRNTQTKEATEVLFISTFINFDFPKPKTGAKENPWKNVAFVSSGSILKLKTPQ